MDDGSLFYYAIENVLNNWPALQLAVEHSSGGINSQEKAHWLIGAVEQYFNENNGLEQDEVEDFLVSFLDDEFNTAVQDGSASEIAMNVCTYYRLFRDDRQELARVVNSLPKPTPPVLKQRIIKEHEVAVSEQLHPSGTKESEKTSTSEGMDVDIEEAGWQTVSRNRRKT